MGMGCSSSCASQLWVGQLEEVSIIFVTAFQHDRKAGPPPLSWSICFANPLRFTHYTSKLHNLGCWILLLILGAVWCAANVALCSRGLEVLLPPVCELASWQAADYKGRIGRITMEDIPRITTEIMTRCDLVSYFSCFLFLLFSHWSQLLRSWQSST